MNFVKDKMARDPMPEFCAVLGSTGSVGEQALDVARVENVPVRLITANKSVLRAEEQIREFHPAYAVMADEGAAKDLAVRVKDTDTRVLSGAEAIGDAIYQLAPPVVIHSILGEAGLMPTLWALDAGCRLGLANKESIVIAGDLVMAKEREGKGKIIPVDSEHSAIFQCLSCGRSEEIKKIILTASGGPFFGRTRGELDGVTVEETLAHPTWKMGAKITVDSATLMNKGFEVIEAVRLFGVSPAQVEVAVHRESIIHSAVEYIDHAVIAQMSVPDMRLCVQYAMSYPCRAAGAVSQLDLFSVGKLTFAKPDMKTFGLLALAFDCVKKGGGATAALNAANEIAVEAFLQKRISFGAIEETVREAVAEASFLENARSLEELIAADRAAREYAKRAVERLAQNKI